MAMTFKIAHIEMNVSNLRKSSKFYQNIISRLGYNKKYTFKDGAGWSNGISTIFIFKCDKKFLKRKYHRKSTGLNHIAFQASTRKEVDSFHSFLLKEKITVLYGGPKDYPHYRGGYYAVYFEDPDRIKLELCFYPKTKLK